MGFDQSVVHNYGQWAKGIFVGRENVYMRRQALRLPRARASASRSRPSHRCRPDLESKYPATLTLAVGGAAIYLGLGVLLGAMAARWRGSAADRLLVGGTLVVSAIPFYVICLVAWIYLSFKLQIFPNTGYYPITENPLKTVSYMMLPWLVLGLTGLHRLRPVHPRPDGGDPQRGLHPDRRGQRRRHAGRAVQARAAGGDRARDHDLRPRLRLPARRTIFVEQIFSIDGIGYWGLQALHDPIDINVISATVLVGAVLIVVANLLVDIFYGFLDPRVTVT